MPRDQIPTMANVGAAGVGGWDKRSDADKERQPNGRSQVFDGGSFIGWTLAGNGTALITNIPKGVDGTYFFDLIWTRTGPLAVTRNLVVLNIAAGVITAVATETNSYSGGGVNPGNGYGFSFLNQQLAVTGMGNTGASNLLVRVWSSNDDPSFYTGWIMLNDYAGRVFSGGVVPTAVNNIPSALKIAGALSGATTGAFSGQVAAVGISNSGAFLNTNRRTVTAATDTISATDTSIWYDATSNNIAITGPAQANGRWIRIKRVASDVSAHTCIFTPASGLVENAATLSLNAGDCFDLESDGTNWSIV